MSKVDMILNAEDSAAVQPHSNQVQNRHNKSVTLGAAAKFVLAVESNYNFHSDFGFWTVHFHNWRKEQTNKMHKLILD